MSGAIHGTVHGTSPAPFPGGMDRKGMEGEILVKALLHPTVSKLPRRPAPPAPSCKQNGGQR
jgi:hypothetical protein